MIESFNDAFTKCPLELLTNGVLNLGTLQMAMLTLMFTVFYWR